MTVILIELADLIRLLRANGWPSVPDDALVEGLMDGRYVQLDDRQHSIRITYEIKGGK